MNFKKFLFLNLCLDSFLLGSFSFLRLRLRKLLCHNFFLQKEGNNSRSWQLSTSNQPGELNDTLTPFICSDNPTAYFGDSCHLFLLNQLWPSLRRKKKIFKWCWQNLQSTPHCSRVRVSQSSTPHWVRVAASCFLKGRWWCKNGEGRTSSCCYLFSH